VLNAQRSEVCISHKVAGRSSPCKQISQHARVPTGRMHYDGGTRREPVIHEPERGRRHKRGWKQRWKSAQPYKREQHHPGEADSFIATKRGFDPPFGTGMLGHVLIDGV